MDMLCRNPHFKHMEITRETINIENILASKLGAKKKFVPRFLVNWLTRIAHQDYVNECLWQLRDKSGSDWLAGSLDYLGVKIKVVGEENLPPKDDGRQYTFVSNHPLGAADGLGLGMVIGKRYDDNFKYLVNDLLMNLPGLAPLCIPINKTGKQSRDFPAMVKAGFTSKNHILMFPAGLCSRKIGGKIQDLPWKKTFITKSVETHRDVIPVYFDGRNSDKFYRIANICKALHLKVNIAMLYLVDEMIKNRNQTFTVRFGKPIPWQTFDKSKSPNDWAQWVRQKVYEL